MKKLFFCDVTDEEFFAVSQWVAASIMGFDKVTPFYQIKERIKITKPKPKK